MKIFIQQNGIKIFFIIFFGIIVAIFFVQKLTVTEMSRTESMTIKNLPVVSSPADKPIEVSTDHIPTPLGADPSDSGAVSKPSKSPTDTQTTNSQRVYEKPSHELFLPQ